VEAYEAKEKHLNRMKEKYRN